MPCFNACFLFSLFNSEEHFCQKSATYYWFEIKSMKWNLRKWCYSTAYWIICIKYLFSFIYNNCPNIMNVYFSRLEPIPPAVLSRSIRGACPTGWKVVTGCWTPSWKGFRRVYPNVLGLPVLLKASLSELPFSYPLITLPFPFVS